jgi:hypothetical protein
MSLCSLYFSCSEYRSWFQAYSAILIKSALCWVVTRRRVVIVYRSFGTAYVSHVQGSRFRKGKDSWPLKMGPIFCRETSVNNYHMTPRNIPKEHRFEMPIISLKNGDRLLTGGGGGWISSFKWLTLALHFQIFAVCNVPVRWILGEKTVYQTRISLNVLMSHLSSII